MKNVHNTRTISRDKLLDRPRLSSKGNNHNYKTNNVCIMYVWDAFTKALLQWKSSIRYFCACVCARACNLTNPACNVPPYCLRSLWLHHIFRHYLTKGTIFGKKCYLPQNLYFDFLYKILFETFLIVERIQRHIVMNMIKSSCKVPVIFVWL